MHRKELGDPERDVAQVWLEEAFLFQLVPKEHKVCRKCLLGFSFRLEFRFVLHLEEEKQEGRNKKDDEVDRQHKRK